MIYKVKNVEQKTTSTNKPMKALVIVDEAGTETKVNIFSDFPRYVDIIPGFTLDGELKQNDKGYTNLYSNEVPQKKPNYAFKQKMMEETIQRKEQGIARAQDNKELSIKIASTMRGAIDLAMAEYTKNPNSLDNLDTLIEKWREWLWMNWDVEDGKYPPF